MDENDWLTDFPIMDIGRSYVPSPSILHSIHTGVICLPLVTRISLDNMVTLVSLVSHHDQTGQSIPANLVTRLGSPKSA